MRLQLTRTKAVLVTFVILAVAPFAYAATRSWFWQREHSVAPVATALYLLVLGAFALGRYRWAWVLLAVFYGGAIVTWGFDSAIRALVRAGLGRQRGHLRAPAVIADAEPASSTGQHSCA